MSVLWQCNGVCMIRHETRPVDGVLPCCGQKIPERIPFPFCCDCGTIEFSIIDNPCRHLGEVIEQVQCSVCGMRDQVVDVHRCGIHGKCVVRYPQRGLKNCMFCQATKQGYEPRELPNHPDIQQAAPSPQNS